jgi:hypothetical protein
MIRRGISSAVGTLALAACFAGGEESSPGWITDNLDSSLAGMSGPALENARQRTRWCGSDPGAAREVGDLLATLEERSRTNDGAVVFYGCRKAYELGAAFFDGEHAQLVYRRGLSATLETARSPIEVGSSVLRSARDLESVVQECHSRPEVDDAAIAFVATRFAGRETRTLIYGAAPELALPDPGDPYASNPCFVAMHRFLDAARERAETVE